MSSSLPLSETLTTDAQHRRNALIESAQQHGIHFSEDMFHGSLTPVLAFSDFVAQSCTQHPEMLLDLVNSGDLFRPYDTDDCNQKIGAYVSGQMDESRFMTQLRRFRYREMVRIAWRDLAGWADLQEVTTTLSRLAESCLESALGVLSEKLYQEYGMPVNEQGNTQQLVILGMGKLGARELNFSSDIDLIFAYPCTGATTGGIRSVSHEFFFVQLCRKLMTALSQRTPDGFVFRVDVNLRPFGANGPLVMSFESMEDYYLHQGREWERYALIKARVVAGDHAAGDRLLATLKPFVFRRYLDFGVFDALREMKLKIAREVSRNSMKFNIKLGPGGIREIEFFAQVFQLIRGGVNPELQTPSLKDALHLLVQHHTISHEVCNQLLQAYDFLRRTEHRIQEFFDQQTHQIPEDDMGRERLAASMGFSETEAFFHELDIQTHHVHTCFATILESPATAAHSPSATISSTESALNSLWTDPADREHDVRLLQKLGFNHPNAILNLLNDLREDTATRALSMDGRRRLDHLMPFLLKEIIPQEDQERALNRIIDILKAIERRTSYLALLLEAPHARQHLVKLACASPLIAVFLSRRPALLDELLDARMLYNPPRKAELEAELTERMRHVPTHDLEYQIEQLCIFKQVNVLRVAAADVTGSLPLMRTSDHLTELAETVLAQVLELSWNYMIEKYGYPACLSESGACNRGFAVIGYGKLGGIELGYGSDLDMVFLHNGDPGVTNGKAILDNAQFFARLGQRVIHMLTAQTSAGSLYEVDMRLRPSGSSGILVCHVNGFEQYQMQNAWTWEHQALVRARSIVGDIRVGERFQQVRKNVLSVFREPEALRKDVAEMREKMRKEHGDENADFFDIKQGKGGIVDIEFLVQYLVLRYAHHHPVLLQWTDNVRLLETLIECEILTDYQAVTLKDAYLTYRAAVHRLNLQKAPAVVPEKRFQEHRSHVKALWKLIMEAR